MEPELLLSQTLSAFTVPSSVLPEWAEIRMLFCSRVSALTPAEVVWTDRSAPLGTSTVRCLSFE